MKESPQSLRAFSDYLAQPPPRSLECLVQTYQSATEPPPPTRRVETLKEWSRAHAWQERVLAHEREIAQEAAKLARKQRLQVACGARAKGVEGLAQLTAQDLARQPAVIVRLLEYADACERKDLGEPDQRVEFGGPEGRHLTFTINIDRADDPHDDV